MISKFDIQKLQDLPIEQVAEALQMTVKHHKSLCPFHADSRPSLTFNRNKNKYRCYVCDARGGTIDLVEHMLNHSFRDACHWLAKTFDIVIDDEDNDRQFQNLKPKPIRQIREVLVQEEKPDVVYLERLMAQPIINEFAAKFLFDERKISMDVVRKLGLSSIAYNCPMSSSPKPSYFDGPALLIPYRDIDGNLISVQSRYLGDAITQNPSPITPPRFRFPKGSQCHIFNLDCLKNLSYNEPIFITEGVSDCLAMLSSGFASIAIPSATLLKPEDLTHLKDRKLHMYPDADDPGNNLFCQLKALLPQLVRHDLPSGFKDVGQYYSFIHKND